MKDNQVTVVLKDGRIWKKLFVLAGGYIYLQRKSIIALRKEIDALKQPEEEKTEEIKPE